MQVAKIVVDQIIYIYRHSTATTTMLRRSQTGHAQHLAVSWLIKNDFNTLIYLYIQLGLTSSLGPCFSSLCLHHSDRKLHKGMVGQPKSQPNVRP